METITQNDLLICRGCLCFDGKLFNINNIGLSSEYYNLLGSQVHQFILPQYLCHICCALLYKFIKFRDRCLQSSRLLGHLKRKMDVSTTSQIKKLNIESKAYYQCTKTEIHDYQPKNSSDTEYILENKHKITTSINIDSKIDAKIIKEDIDETDLEIKSEDLFTQITTYDSDENVVNDCTDNKTKNVKDNYESDDQALVRNKSSHKLTRNIKTKQIDSRKQNVKREGERTDARISQKRENRFETKENLADFEMLYNVDIIVLSKEEQLSDVLERKTSVNYLQSPYKCELCFKGFMDEENLKKHHKGQHDANRGSIVCEFCKFRYKDKRGLNQHLKKHRLKFACRQCKYISRTSFNVKEHYKMHSGRTHACEQCGKSYEKLSSHLSHMRIHHPSALIWCEFCGESFIGEFGLNGHKKRTHRDLKFPPEAKCLNCKVNFTNEEALNKHASRQASICGIPCVHCGTDFHAKSDLKQHLLEEHRSKKKYSCEKCSKVFSKESLYSAHYRRIHVDTNLKSSSKLANWICEVCGKALPSKCLLVYHQRNHSGERPYQCTECPKSFTMKKRLQSHRRVHTSARPYACKSCPKTFKGLSALRAHENVHSGSTKVSSRNKFIV